MKPYKVNAEGAHRVVVLFSSDEVREVDEIGMAMGFRSRAEAIRHLIRQGRLSVQNAKGPAEVAASPSHVTHQPS